MKHPQTNELKVRFLGVRGTVAPNVPSGEFGNHTTSIEVRAGTASPVIADLGTGAIGAGMRLLDEGIRDFVILLTHLHLDHLNGALAFAPFYRDDCRVRILAARDDVQDALQRLFAPPFHPVPFNELKSNLSIERIPVGEPIRVPGRKINVTAAPVPHPQGAVAYRFEAEGNAFVFASDIELAAETDTAPFASLLSSPFPGAAAAIDGFFQPHEINRFADWGHSTWEQAAALCQNAGVQRLIVTHHHFAADDNALRRMERETDHAWAREGTTWTVANNQATPSDSETLIAG